MIIRRIDIRIISWCIERIWKEIDESTITPFDIIGPGKFVTADKAKALFDAWRQHMIHRLKEECDLEHYEKLDKPKRNPRKDRSDVTVELVDDMEYMIPILKEREKEREKGKNKEERPNKK
jgi:hypothetical protein